MLRFSKIELVSRVINRMRLENKQKKVGQRITLNSF